MTRLQVAYQGSATRNSLAEAMNERTVAVLPVPKITNRSSAARLLVDDRAMAPIHSRNRPELGDQAGRKGRIARMNGRNARMTVTCGQAGRRPAAR